MDSQADVRSTKSSMRAIRQDLSHIFFYYDRKFEFDPMYNLKQYSYDSFYSLRINERFYWFRVLLALNREDGERIWRKNIDLA